MPLRIVSRKAWGAEPAMFQTYLIHPVQYVFCMSTHTSRCFDDHTCRWAVRCLQIRHIHAKMFRDMRFSFLIGESGLVYEGRGWDCEPMLPSLYSKCNPYSLLIGCLGKFTEKTLPEVMLEARQKLVDYGIAHKYISENFKPYEILTNNRKIV